MWGERERENFQIFIFLRETKRNDGKIHLKKETINESKRKLNKIIQNAQIRHLRN